MDYLIEVLPYNPDWPRLYQEEAARIRQALGSAILATEHMGSTAIPGMRSKPIIDILVQVKDIEQVDRLNGELAKLGYDAKGEFGVPGRRFFVKNQGLVRTHHIHIFQSGHPEIERVLNFRDYLACHPQDAQAYGSLKDELAQRYRLERERYTEGKSEFIHEIDRKAREWKLEDH